MNEKIALRSEAKKRSMLFALAGILSGIVNGLLGTGGGILTVLFLSKIYAKDSSYSTKDIFAITLCSSVIMSMASLLFYLSSGCFSVSDSALYMLAAVPGGVLGAILLEKLSSKTMKLIFALLVVCAGISMMIKL
ncbi:MAG: sulfite exporter TauE/SafE family protein [Eubacterium sp.]|nr:sulfite exporter TauE/SafE family protein [Eubacterium sp.]